VYLWPLMRNARLSDRRAEIQPKPICKQNSGPLCFGTAYRAISSQDCLHAFIENEEMTGSHFFLLGRTARQEICLYSLLQSRRRNHTLAPTIEGKVQPRLLVMFSVNPSAKDGYMKCSYYRFASNAYEPSWKFRRSESRTNCLGPCVTSGKSEVRPR